MIQSGTFWVVLGLAAAVFWLLPARWRMGFLAAVSIGFLSLGIHSGVHGWRASIIGTTSVLAWSLLFYWLSPRGVLPVLICSITLYLICFKCIGQFKLAPRSSVSQLIPLGLSYFTFKLIHYAVEVARGGIRDRSLSRFLAWMFLFPAFTAGPIQRFDHFLANREETLRLQSIVEGLTRIVHGLIKKLVIAEIVLRPAFDFAANGQLVRNLRATPTWSVWLSAIVVYLYLYMDFSAYSDIAIGASRLFGLRIMENFNYPVLACNAADFWKRWHITLAGWCQSYIYMPVVALTRKPYVAVYATFVAIGLWHEISVPWLIWGLYHATGVSLYQALARTMRARKRGPLDRGLWRYLCIPPTFVFVVVGTVLVFGGLHRMRDILQVLAKLVGLTWGHA